MAKVAVVYHSGYGHTAKVAQAVAAGAEGVAGVEVSLVAVADIEQHWNALDAADAIVFGAPTYMGSASAPFKAFMDATSARWYLSAWQDKLAGGFTNSASWSGDKLNTLVQLAVFAGQHGMLWVSLGILPGNNSSTGSSDDLNRVGSYLGLMTQSNNDQGPDIAPPASDLETSRLYGKRIAEHALRAVRGKQA